MVCTNCLRSPLANVVPKSFCCPDGKGFTRLASPMSREGSRGGADLMQGPSQSVEDFEINAGLRDPRDSSTDAEHRQQVDFCQ